MLEMKFVRENVEKVRAYLKARNSDFNVDDFLKLDEEKRYATKSGNAKKREK